MRFYHNARLSPKQAETPEGFLICEDVPVARTGTMYYGPGETPIMPAKDTGVVTILREEVDVFRPETLASFQGKPVTIGHPPMGVNSRNWASIACGVMLNPRRGEGEHKDHIVADLLITTDEGIHMVRSKKLREVSCGYDCQWMEDANHPGNGKQTNIVGNHVALVPAGRCGPTCAIGDHDIMPAARKKLVTQKVNAADALRTAIATSDQVKIDAIMAEFFTGDEEFEQPVEVSGHHGITINVGGARDDDPPFKKKKAKKDDDDDDDKKTEDRLTRIESVVADIALMVAGDDTAIARLAANNAAVKAVLDAKAAAKLAADAAAAAAQPKPEDLKLAQDDGAIVADFRSTKERAEILIPGVGFPTFDNTTATVKFVRDALCEYRKVTLQQAMKTQQTFEVIKSVIAGRDVAAMDCSAVDSTFIGAAELMRAHRSPRAGAQVPNNTPGMRFSGPAQIPTAAQFNKTAEAFWAKQNPVVV